MFASLGTDDFILYSQCAKAALRSILDPAAFPQGFTIQNKLAAVTFARSGCFIKAYAKTTWSFPDEGEDRKIQEYLYWDDAAYGLCYDSPAYRTALATKAAEAPRGDDVDDFLNSLASEGQGMLQEKDNVQPPPSINLALAGALYALRSMFLTVKHTCTLSDSLTLADHLASLSKVRRHSFSPPGASINLTDKYELIAERKKPTELIVSKKVSSSYYMQSLIDEACESLPAYHCSIFTDRCRY